MATDKHLKDWSYKILSCEMGDRSLPVLASPFALSLVTTGWE